MLKNNSASHRLCFIQHRICLSCKYSLLKWHNKLPLSSKVYSVSVAFLNCSFLFHLSFGVHFYHSKNSLDNIFFQPKLPVSKILSDFLYQQIEFIQFATNTDLFTFQPFHHAPTMLNCGVMSVYSIQRRPELIIKLDNTRWVNHNSLTLNMHQAHVWHRLQENIREIGRDSFQNSSPENVAQCQTPGRSASFFSSIEKFSNNFVCGCTFYSRIILLLVCPLRSNFIGQFTKCVKQSRTSTIWSSNKLLVCICCGCVCVRVFLLQC